MFCFSRDEQRQALDTWGNAVEIQTLSQMNRRSNEEALLDSISCGGSLGTYLWQQGCNSSGYGRSWGSCARVGTIASDWGAVGSEICLNFKKT
jgi:hypothetical protein